MIIKYIIAIFLGIVSSSFLSIIITILRVGIPLCNACEKDENSLKEEKEIANIVKNKYQISLFFNSFMVLAISLLVYFLLKDVLITYVVAIIIYTLISFKATGMTQSNLQEFLNTFETNKSIYYFNDKNI